MRILTTAAALAGCLLVFAGFAQAGAFQNGSFEDPGGVVRDVFGGSITNSYVTGWLHSGAGTDVYETNGQDFINAGDGDFWVSFGHSGTSGGILEQTFDTIAGHLYIVSFLLTVQQGTDAQSMFADACSGGCAGSLGSVSLNDFTTNTWFTGTFFTFTADSASTRLMFIDTTVGGANANWGLDGVTVDDFGLAPGGGVPEPGTLALAGSALLAAWFRRRRQ
jgi:hypothetical protein